MGWTTSTGQSSFHLLQLLRNSLRRAARDAAGADGLVHSFQEISSYLERQYDDILAEESRIKRNPRFRDNRVHALLYFIAPTGHA